MTRVFISYSHKDEPLRAELDKHLSLLKRQGELDIWTDHRIPVGGELGSAISEALENADVIMLLLSADFLASDYCFGVEMTRAMERHERGDAVVLPVMLRPCDYQSAPFGRLKAVPTDGRPVTKWPNQDDAFVDIVQHVRRLLSSRHQDAGSATLVPSPSDRTSPAAAKHSAPTTSGISVARVARSSNLSLPRQFSDQDKHDFAQSTFDYIREYFEGSLQALQERNEGIQSRMSVLSPHAFTVVIFKNGKRLAGCNVRLGGIFGGNGIAYSNNENSAQNSYNEHLSIEADQQMLHLKATMAMFHGASESKLSQEGAAEHLWSMLISPFQ
jgi:hypothetical protein